MIPPAFAERFLWGSSPPSVEATVAKPSKDGDIGLPGFRFSASVLSELSSLAVLAFSKAEKPRSAVDSASAVPPEKCLVLSCPTKEGTHIIDAAVRHVADKHDADVLVLDALELSAGKLGTLGKEGQVLDGNYASAVAGSTSSDTTESTSIEESNAEESKPEDKKPLLSERSRALIDSLLRLPAASKGELDQEAQPPIRRIIYLRDFQYIIDAAKPLLTHILQSLHESRVESPSRPVTILVFGSTTDSESLKVANTPTPTQENCMFLSSLFTHVRTGVANRPTSGCTCSSCQPWRGSSPTVNLEPIPFNADWGKKVDELSNEKLSISVFATNVKSGATGEEWQKASNLKKIRRVNQLLLRACLEKEGCPVEGNWDEGSFDSVFEKKNPTLLEVEEAKSIVTITMGLVADASSPPSSESEPPDAPPSSPKLVDLVSQAYKTFVRRKKERSDWENGNDPTENDDDSKTENETETKPAKDTYDDVSGTARELLGCIIDTDEITTTFTDVFVDDAIVDSLKTIITLPLLFPQYFNAGVLSKEAIGGVLLYGPPGTGKTMLCRALAKSCKAKMLHIKPSDINNKWVGESEKRVTAVFELAHRLAPCIIFIDEIDSLFSSRNDCTKSWERNIGMDGLRSAKKNRENNVVLVGATNRPFDLDLAVLRRLPRRILVDMPNLPTRKAILQSYLKDETLQDGVDLDKLALQTEGFSGSDLKNLCVAAALSSVKEAIGPDWRNLDSKPATNPSTPTSSAPSTNNESSTEDPSKKNAEATQEKANEKDEKDKSSPELPLRTITPANIAQARNEISRSTFGSKRGDELYKWHEKYSTDGNTTTATGTGLSGTTSRSRLGSEFYSSGSGLARPGMSGHWNRWANKSGVNGTGPTVATTPAPGTPKDE